MASKCAERISVLIAVADAEERSRLERILSHSTWLVHPASTLREAAAMLRQSQPGVVVSGLRFPSEGSWESLIREAQQFVPSPRIVVTCRFADEAVWAAVLNLGGYDVLMQPFDSQEVFQVLSSAYRSWRGELGWTTPGEAAKAKAPAAA